MTRQQIEPRLGRPDVDEGEPATHGSSAQDASTGLQALEHAIRQPISDAASDARHPGRHASIGTFLGLSPAGVPLVDHDRNPSRESLEAVSIVEVEAIEIGARVVLAFENADLLRPVLLGTVWEPRAIPEGAATARVDGEAYVIRAEREIVLSCGKASITLTRAGKVLIRGEYVLSRSSGVNSIKGGTVQIN